MPQIIDRCERSAVTAPQCNSYGMSRTHEELPARPAYDSGHRRLLERTESLGAGAMTVQKILSWRAYWLTRSGRVSAR